MSSCVHGGQAPDVTEWGLPTQAQVTVVPTEMVVVLLPLTWSMKFVPPWPTLTVRAPPAGGVGVTVGPGDVGVAVGPARRRRDRRRERLQRLVLRADDEDGIGGRVVDDRRVGEDLVAAETTITALSVCVVPAPAALKIP